MKSIVIAGATRTAIGAFNGGLSALSAVDLGVMVIQEALSRAQTTPEEVSEVIMGQVLTAGAGQNPARQAAVRAGIPTDRTGLTINQVCGSGLRAVALAAQSIQCGDAEIVVAGGQESMSRAPHCAHLRSGVKMGPAEMADTMIVDGLWDAFNQYHMGTTAENVAQQWKISRAMQDELAATSQQRAQAAIESGRFKDEILPVNIAGKKGETVVDTDEHPRYGTTIEALAKLRPAFSKEGSVTAGNASGLNDGAAALVVMSEATAEAKGVEPLARIVSWASRGVDPAVMGTGPIPSSQAALERAEWKTSDLDLVEANEAFAAQACAVNQQMGWSPDRVNVNGGAIALGHPIGASGARVLVTLLHEMKKRSSKKGIATLCIGGGMGIALCVERS